MIILQISPEFEAGTGVGGVAAALEREWIALGHDVRRFGPKEAGCAFLCGPSSGLLRRVKHAARVLWFSTVGTVRARRAVVDLPPGSISVCHNDALVGDVYVNHGLLTQAMRARGSFEWRMIRNPLHIFTVARDYYRYRSGLHRMVVSLSEKDRSFLAASYETSDTEWIVIPNGVDLDRFPPAEVGRRREVRQRLGVPTDARVAIFVGHEFDRKGLPILLEALHDLHDHFLIVVGGSERQVFHHRAQLSPDLRDRVVWLGSVPDPRFALEASDVLVLPSAYEANPLVVLEALATGLQVVASDVGSNRETLVDTTVSRLVERSVQGVLSGLRDVQAVSLGREETVARARALAGRSDWSAVAAQYIELFRQVRR